MLFCPHEAVMRTVLVGFHAFCPHEAVMRTVLIGVVAFFVLMKHSERKPFDWLNSFSLLVEASTTKNNNLYENSLCL
jgi:sterol desaturase/sphingolipid hydroxylase (fatty acid hydroxylase superfamily)